MQVMRRSSALRATLPLSLPPRLLGRESVKMRELRSDAQGSALVVKIWSSPRVTMLCLLFPTLLAGSGCTP